LILPPGGRYDEAPDGAFLEALPEALLVNKDRGEGSLKRSIGRNLSRLAGRIFNGRKLTDAAANKHKHVRKWKLDALTSGHRDAATGGAR
jgi:hypothetical protein